MRLAVYTDYRYSCSDGVVYAERAFGLFLKGLGERVESLTLIGRLTREPKGAHYAVASEADLVGLPDYPSLADPLRALPALARSLRALWRAAGDADVIWALGPHPLAIALALIGKLRRRRVFLGVRQDLPAYVATRHPERRAIRAAAGLLELAFRALARVTPVVAIGPDLASHYRRASRVLDLTVSLIGDDDLIPADVAEARWRRRPVRVLSVGRLDEEKNPLMLLEVLARLRERDGDDAWRLVVCGDGPLEDDMREAVAARGLGKLVEIRGYVPFGEQLWDAYRSSHALLHVSLTEGFPQVVVEAFAAGLAVVATSVGGIPAAVGDGALLIPPADAQAAVDALEQVAGDGEARRRLLGAGEARARELTGSRQLARLVDYLRSTENDAVPS
jgi:glycosyltransferase involved in cell wall biosynthesis